MRKTAEPTYLAVLSCGSSPDAWPIEVAWGRAGEQVRSMLLRPAARWGLGAWDKGVEASHRIALEQILAEGKDPLDACLVLNAALGGETVVVGAPETDCVWLYKLYSAGDVTPNFKLVGGSVQLPDAVIRAGAAVEMLQDHEASAQTG